MSDDSNNMEALSLAVHDFSLSLYMELVQNTTGNIFYSPFGIHVVMFMASIGASSKTSEEMIAALNLNTNTYSLEVYKTFLDDLTIDNDDLKLATGMFVDSSFNLKECFVEIFQFYLKSCVDKLNFKNDPETQRQSLNNWVLNQTNNKINELFPKDSIDSSTTLILANALHFKRVWENEFQEAVDEPFYLITNDQIMVKMMSLEKDLNYYHDDRLKFAALQLPYKGHAYSMIILLPDAKDGLKNLENNLFNIKLDDIVNSMVIYDVAVKLPRFKIEHYQELKETLSNLGCPTMFTKDANFSNFGDGNVCVSKVVHKACIEVDELQVTEAEVDPIEIQYMMIPNCSVPREQNPWVEFVADHPFIMFIITCTRDILFMGRVSEP